MKPPIAPGIDKLNSKDPSRRIFLQQILSMGVLPLLSGGGVLNAGKVLDTLNDLGKITIRKHDIWWVMNLISKGNIDINAINRNINKYYPGAPELDDINNIEIWGKGLGEYAKETFIHNPEMIDFINKLPIGIQQSIQNGAASFSLSTESLMTIGSKLDGEIIPEMLDLNFNHILGREGDDEYSLQQIGWYGEKVQILISRNGRDWYNSIRSRSEVIDILKLDPSGLVDEYWKEAKLRSGVERPDNVKKEIKTQVGTLVDKNSLDKIKFYENVINGKIEITEEIKDKVRRLFS